MSLLQFLFKKRKNKKSGKTTEEELFQNQDIPYEYSVILDKNKKNITQIFNQSFDFKMDEIIFGTKPACICYLGTTLSKSELSTQVLKPIQQSNKIPLLHLDIEKVREELFPTISYEYADTLHKVVWHILNGYAVILIDGLNKALSLEIGQTEKRSIAEPSTQTIIRGPKDAFIEELTTNISLVRRRLKTPNLTFEKFEVGKDTRTAVVIAFISNITNKDILEEVRYRIGKIEVSGILDSGNIEEFIADKSITPFPLSFNTERPDSIVGHLLDGKVAIFVDGSPFVLTVPGLLVDFFQSSEDYYQPYLMASFIRMVRYTSFMIALLLPSMYVALSTFHQELLPTFLLISVQAQREGVPFPAVIEIVIMELTFEVLREAGIRMPRAVGQTVSIVGALVIGQAAVEAGLVSNVLVIVVAFTAIASFVSPIYNFSVATRLLRFILIFLSAILGLYGVLLFLILMVIHLVSLRSFGVPYMAPVAPFIIQDQQDVFIRFPNWANKRRPSYLFTKSPLNIKQDANSKPSPPPQKTGDQS